MKTNWFAHCGLKRTLPPVLWLLSAVVLQAQSAEELARQVQGHYNQLKTMKTDFRQIYEANSVRQEENGSLWIRKPGQMRWEYHQPEFKLFLTDGKNTYFHVPSARQVTVRRLTSEDLHFTPFGFLVGSGDLLRDFEISAIDPKDGAVSNIRVLRLLPRRPLENVSSMNLEVEARSARISALVVSEYTGGTSRFEFSGMLENPPLASRLFAFRIPKGVEVVRLDEP